MRRCAQLGHDCGPPHRRIDVGPFPGTANSQLRAWLSGSDGRECDAETASGPSHLRRQRYSEYVAVSIRVRPHCVKSASSRPCPRRARTDRLCYCVRDAIARCCRTTTSRLQRHDVAFPKLRPGAGSITRSIFSQWLLAARINAASRC